MTRIPKTEEQLAMSRMSFTTVMEPQEAFIGRATRQPSVRARLPLKVEPSKVKLKG
jgi:hypothetical protein